jgi:hypothetical protein
MIHFRAVVARVEAGVRDFLHDVMAKQNNDDVDWGRFLGVGLEIAIGAVLGYFVGRWADRKFNWGNYGTLGGVMLGVGAGMYLLIKDAIRINKD